MPLRLLLLGFADTVPDLSLPCFLGAGAEGPSSGNVLLTAIGLLFQVARIRSESFIWASMLGIVSKFRRNQGAVKI